MEQSIFSFSIDKDLKKQFDLLCEDFGMTVSAVINIFVKSVIKDRKIPFEIVDSEESMTTPTGKPVSFRCNFYNNKKCQLIAIMICWHFFYFSAR